MKGTGRNAARVVGASVAIAVACFCALRTPAVADVASDQAAAIIVFPKIVVDTTIPPQTPRGRVDTLIRVSNTSSQPLTMKCFYINANGHCSNSPSTVCTPGQVPASSPCGPAGLCVPGWAEADFTVNITARQPIAWLASEGAVACEESPPGLPCLPLNASGFESPNTNGGSRVPPVSEDPFVGELKCIVVDRSDLPLDRNDLKGEAEIVRSNPGVVDVLAYNAIGIPAIAGANSRDSVLVLGGPNAEYSSCPNVLIMDHFFDGAQDPVSGDEVTTDLTLVPCTEDFVSQVPVTTPVQFLVFNEFEQRFSTSRRVTCFDEVPLSRIDSSSPNRSIFSAAVAGTLTGQTRIRGVPNQDATQGHALLGLGEEFRSGGGGAAFNLHFHGTRQQSDFIYLP
jgi:hypothetical protein